MDPHTVVLAAGNFNTDGVSDWLKSNIVPLIILAAGIMLMLHSRSGDNARAVKGTGPVLIGLLIIGLSFGAWPAFSQFLVGLLGG